MDPQNVAAAWQTAETTDLELVEQSKQGDEEAMTMLIRRHYGTSLRIARRYFAITRTQTMPCKRHTAVPSTSCIRSGKRRVSVPGSPASSLTRVSRISVANGVRSCLTWKKRPKADSSLRNIPRIYAGTKHGPP